MRALPRGLGALIGIIAGAVAVTTGMLLASLGHVASPIDAVGSSFIDRTPPWLKELAINWFGTNDKTALRVGIVLVLASGAIILGTLGAKTPAILMAGIIAFATIGAFSAAEHTGSTWVSTFAPMVGAICGVIAVLWLNATAGRSILKIPIPGRSRVPLGVDRRGFLRTSATMGVASIALAGLAHRGEQSRIDRIEAQLPDSLPPTLTEPPQTLIDIAETVTNEGMSSYITANDNFYRIDTALSFPAIDLATWTLKIHGLVDKEIVLTYADIAALPQIEKTITICCVSNEVGGPLIGNAVWQGIYLKDLLDMAGVQAQAEQVFSTSLDGWNCGFPIGIAMDGRDALLAIGMNGEPLPLAHGFPARLIVPGLYGYVSATKWLADIELNRWVDGSGYWVPRGWSRDAPIKTHSRIDVPRQGHKVSTGIVHIAGVAWAQHTGVAKVEVRIDKGEWLVANLSQDTTDDAWRLWNLDWQADSVGKYSIQVRATDKSGYTQTEEVASVAPDGATGWHTRTVKVV